jgi:hypothetical protein
MTEPFWSRFKPGWVAVTAVATVVLAVVAALAYVWPRDAEGTDDVATAPPVAPDPAATASQPPTGGTAPTEYLADLTPVTGGSRIVPLPEELEGAPGYERAVVIACPSNQTGDENSEVTYETRRRYETLGAALRPYRDPPDDVLVNLWFYSDPEDRLPGAAPPGDPHPEQLRMGEVRTVQEVDISDAYFLRLRVECQLPDGYMILTEVMLHPVD